MMVKAGVLGATGYAGAELVRLLLQHPQVSLAAIASKTFVGRPLSEVYPSYAGFCDLQCVSQEETIERSDVVFAALPHGLSEPIAAACAAKGKKLIDLGADFRLQSEEAYETWYDGRFADAALHEKAVYGLPELFRDEIAGAQLVANPGCYPTAAALGLYPALKRGLIETDGIVIDAKSGATGAGRALRQTTHFVDCNENIAPYKVAAHRHTPEIEQTLMRAAGKRLRVCFVPHLLPVDRGIVATMYTRLKLGAGEQAVRDAYEAFYYQQPFVRLRGSGQTACIKQVRYTNLCDISLHADPRTGMLIIVSAIDNMIKGAAGQAIQNMNLLFGLPEDMGLRLAPPAF